MAKPAVPAAPAGEPDPSMDDILASIRRILDEEPPGRAAASDDVLLLDAAMMVDEPAEPPVAPQTLEPRGAIVHTPPVIDDPVAATPPPVPRDAPPAATPAPTPPVTPSVAPAATLVAPEAAAAAATSVGALMRTLAAERGAALGRSGVTIEDLVREQLNPLLKQWLDAHLPPIVERLVRAEIERVVGREAG